MSILEKTAAAPKVDMPLIENRFALRRKIASTALADIYWADDLYTPTQGEKDHLMLLILATPSIISLPGFAKAWSAVMSRPAPPAAAYPTITDWGNAETHYWFSCPQTQGSLLSEYLHELDKHKLTPDQALQMTAAISHALNNVQAGAFGYFEPGATLHLEASYVLLNAPLVKVMHLLLRQQTGVRAPLALHSPWLSPSVAIGDLPVTEDDSFSLASLYQMLVGQQLPYGQESTLTALAHGTSATIYPKFKTETRELLSQALSLQRNQRPENPEALIKGLGRKNHRKLLLPLAVLAAVGVVVYASYHLVSKFNGLLNEPTTTTQTATSANPATPEAPKPPAQVNKTDQVTPATDTLSLVNETTLPTPEPLTTSASSTVTPNTDEVTVPPTAPQAITQAELATATPATTSTTATNTPSATETNPETTAATNPEASSTTTVAQQTPVAETNPSNGATDVTPLILKATAAFNTNQNTGNTETLNLLRQVWSIDRQNPNARALLNQVIAQQQQQTESHLNLTRLTEAKQSLAQTDDLIREFNLTDRIEEQVRLENQIEIHEREAKEAAELIQQAQAALKRGNLSKEDGADNASAHLNKLMFMLPNHPKGRELLNELVQMRQTQIKRDLERNRLTRAGSALEETSRLIRKYRLTSQTKAQNSLEQDYRQAIEVQQAQTAPSQTPDTEAETNLVVTEQETPEQPVMIVPPPVEGERYVTPNDDLTVLNPQPPTTEPAIEQVVIPEVTVQNPEPAPRPVDARPIRRPQPAPRPRSEEIEIEGGPAQVEVPEQTSPPVSIQPTIIEQTIEQTQPIVTQTEELPAEVALPAPPATAIDAGIINNQGILDAQIITTPLTEEEIPDSERK
ncbi:hypothetical protein SAMN02745130_03640 [Thiothrix eikelboomii]|uniref:Uncharacterized protein n=1 Tax=Thiothrix eikelboomii TaxID=92487 RepID=A0A1T4XXK6_9GAMM|nr:hypothetical protein [Thiothrix eikelboomii]SKA94277.1 hypothetical protein SAMN02745130_03640 [Thiothrix eikelboomii]